ncbi:tripartite tricarboxylate transporter substrate binding protein [Variovorax sp. YR216]|uniref:Bug family tripartite tricarboxylate transporter substrate binding protein n=1 Tax=Variovorax sp. YR216 TaxID=1882828 RepID=UPI000899FE4B|nr:tripartite tricarboxylate transporter substrate binding protein [Variovorax sp. YR216]SEB05508.1 Tripartite-type tricarboxylate transporter, receptor component TctC [Variovorax sp. YR216]
MKRGVLLPLALACAMGASAPAFAEGSTFPSRPVTLVVPFTPSSGSDIIARIIGPRLAARWGQPVVVDNRPGASGNLGTAFVAKAPGDGYTLLMAINTHTITPAIYRSLPYDALRDFAPIAKLADADLTLAVNPNLPVKDMKSLIAYGKANPGRLNYATPGNGTPHHLAMELLKTSYGVSFTHVPYKGISGALTDLMGSHVDLMFASVPSVRTHAQAGKVRLLAVTGERRSSQVPDVPTFREQGFADMDAVNAWYAVLAPARTPPELVARLNADFVAVMNTAEVKAELAQQGLQVSTGTPAQLGSLIQSDMARWKKVVSAAGITAD